MSIQLLTDCHGSRHRLTLKHTSTAEKIQGIFLLSENTTRRNWGNLNAKKIPQRPEVLDSEIRT
jgi:hypothetical protein